MEIGKPLRELIVEPLELPAPVRPVDTPDRAEQPEREPVRHG